jgi:hypothetical protein
MRDPDRIEVMLDKLREVWLTDPDLRLGQIIVISTKPNNPCPEVFHVEDNKLLKGLDEYLDKKKQNRS